MLADGRGPLVELWISRLCASRHNRTNCKVRDGELLSDLQRLDGGCDRYWQDTQI